MVTTQHAVSFMAES